jgi:hypothetical protein
LWNSGTYLALISVCRRQQQGDRALNIYEVSCLWFVGHCVPFFPMYSSLVDVQNLDN